MSELDERLASLSPEKRALLELRLAARRGAGPATAATGSADGEIPASATAAPTIGGPAKAAESRPAAPPRPPGMGFSLFYFSSNAEPGNAASALRLFFAGADFADRRGFEAVWIPERHFHRFGGLFPNPAVAAAALASRTHHVALRSGSVVLPLHHPIRVAEEWSLVDHYSGGRVGLAFASGWHANDFALAPAAYADRREAMFRQIDTVKRLWRGERLPFADGAGQEIELEIFPKPVQSVLPVWITAAANPDTYLRAGAIGANVLTHLLGQSVDVLAERIASYRRSREEHGFDPAGGQVTLMLHTFLGDDREEVRRRVRGPFCDYLRSFTELLENLGRSRGVNIHSGDFSAADMDALLDFAFQRYFNTSGLFGSVESCLPLVDRLAAIGVGEIACLIDFGVETDAVLAGLEHLDALRLRVRGRAPAPPATPTNSAVPAVEVAEG